MSVILYKYFTFFSVVSCGWCVQQPLLHFLRSISNKCKCFFSSWPFKCSENFLTKPLSGGSILNIYFIYSRKIIKYFFCQIDALWCVYTNYTCVFWCHLLERNIITIEYGIRVLWWKSWNMFQNWFYWNKKSACFI